MAQKIDKNNLDVAYILWWFPWFSETFIINEIQSLIKDHRVSIRVFSNKKIEQYDVHPEAKWLFEYITYLPLLLSFRTIKAFFYFLFTSPIQFLKLVYTLLSFTPLTSINLAFYHLFQSVYCLFKGLFIARQLMANPPTHLHSHYAESSAYITLVVGKLLNIPYSFTMHAHDIFVNKNKPLIVHLIRNSRFAVTISEFNKKYLCEMDSAIGYKIKIVHCGIDLLKHGHEPMAKANGTFRLLTVARLVKSKGIHKVIEALAGLENKSDIRYKIIGDGPEKENLKRLVRDKQMDHIVELMGPQISSRVRKELKSTDVFVLNCIIGEDGNMDGIPVALMESMANKLPVLSTQLTGIPELIKDGSGLLNEPEDIFELRENIQKIMQMSSNERMQMGLKGRSIIEEQFDLIKETAKLKQLFNTA